MTVLRISAMLYGMCLSSCHNVQSAKIQKPMYLLTGVVHSSDGRLIDNSLIVVSNIATTDEILTTRTDSKGRFSVESPVPEIALTATSTQEWIFIPKIEIGHNSLSIHLQRDCVAFQGRIVIDNNGQTSSLETFRIGGLGNDIGDSYGISVDLNYNFKACLPPADYFITLPSRFVAQTILTKIPSSEDIVIHTTTTQAAESSPSQPLKLTPMSRVAFVENLVDSVRVIGLAESNHGTGEFSTERSQLSTSLARTRHFNIVMIEAGYAETLALNDYINGLNVSIFDALKGLGIWIWNTRSFLQALDELRRYNLNAPADQRITLVGIDTQTTKAAIDYLTKSRDVTLSIEQGDLLNRLREKEGASWADFSAEQKKEVRYALEHIVAEHDSHGLETTRNKLALTAHSILLCLKLLSAQGFWPQSRVRDEGMAEMVVDILQLAPRARATIWAHLVHLSREYVVGAPTMGSHLARSNSLNYRVYALLAYQGSILARTPDGDRHLTSHPINAAPKHTLEGVLARTSRSFNDNVSYWDFGRASSSDLSWLRGLHWLRLIGAVYPQNGQSLAILPLDALDGAVLFHDVTASNILAESN